MKLQVAFAVSVMSASLALSQENLCDPNYEEACVPVASDVDCEFGNGNGPAYVIGPVRVVGKDIYELDRDGDGIACEIEEKQKE